MAFSIPIQLRFADLDVMGHVNNANYLHYFETARMHFFNNYLPDWDWKKNGFLLAKNEVEYIIPTTLENQIKVELGCCKIGTKSFELYYKVINEKDQVMAKGKSIVVCFDYSISATIEIPKLLNEVLKKNLAQ